MVDRLRRRIELYRRHHNVCIPIHENTTNGLNEQHRRETLLLRQKFLEAKAKKAKKNEHRSIKESTPQSPKIISHPKPLKAPADSSPAIATPDVVADDSANAPGTENTTSDQQGRDQPVLPSFSVQIVQQFTNTNSSQPQNSQTIQTNVTVKALPSAVAKCNSPGSVAAGQQKDSRQQQQQNPQTASQLSQSQVQPKIPSQQPQSQEQATSISGDTNIECKQEKEGSASDLCQRKKTSSSTGSGGRLSDTFPSIGFAEDSSDDVIHPDILKDLIDDVFTNSADLMKDFNFEDSVGSVKDQDDVDKDTDASIIDLVKGSSSPQLQPFSNGSGVFDSQSNSSQQAMELFPRESVSSTNSMPVLTTTTSVTTPTTTGLYPPPVRLPAYSNHNGTSLNISSGLGLDFKLTEPSPAALTLKQMAEQHQNMQQKHQHINMRIGSPSNPSSRTQCNQESFGDHMSSIRSGFINGAPTALSAFPKGPNHNGLFNSVAFDPPYPGVEPLRSVFKQEVCLTNMGSHMSEASLQSQQGLHISQIPGRPSAVTTLKSPAYGATRPLTHYPDPLEQSNVNRPMSGQYNTSVPMDSRIQMTQNPPMHIGHNQQLPQQIHSASPDVKQQQAPSNQTNSNLYSTFAGQFTNSPIFHNSMPQTLPYNSQYGTTSGLGRPPPEYKATQSDITSNSMPMVDHQSSDPSSRMMYNSVKNGFPQHQRAPNVTVSPDRFGLPPRPNEWRHGLIHPHHNAIRMEVYAHQDGYNNAMLAENPHLSGMPRSSLHPQYRMIGPQIDNVRIPRQQVVPPGQVVMHQRQPQMALHPPPVNQALPSSGMELQAAVNSLPVGSGASAQTTVPSQIYGHPDITRQEGHHINLDFLDNFESIASDFLNFDQGNGANFPLLDDVEMLSK